MRMRLYQRATAGTPQEAIGGRGDLPSTQRPEASMTESQSSVGGSADLALAELVRAYRRRAGLTQPETARLAGISAAALRNLEQGRVTAPRERTLRGLARALRLSVAEAESLHLAAKSCRASAGLHIGVLGPLTISVNKVAIDLGSRTQRTLLARLALSPHTPVSRDELIEVGWGSDGPATAADALHTQMSRLRRKLGQAAAAEDARQLLVATAGGYQLNVDNDQVDVGVFDRLLARARQSRAAEQLTLACDQYARCLQLWRGAPLSDIPSLRIHPEVVRLTHLLLDVVVEYATTAAELGRDAEVVPLLRQAAVLDPLNETVHARLMLALAACGQQATALAVFDRLRRRLAEEFGTAPGRELSEAHRQVLRQDSGHDGAAPVRSLHQLPADIAEFTGRGRELARLHSLVPPADTNGTAVPVLVIQGMAGVGKTRLAVHFAHQLVARGRFRDVQLFADLRANADLPSANPAVVLASFLRQLGVPGTEIPDDVDGRAAMFRAQLYGREALVLLDDAATVEQVQPLIPASPANLVIITSRRLLALDGAFPIALDVLPTFEAVELLARLAGPDRVNEDNEAARQIVNLCGNLPLAVALAARRLQARPSWTLRSFAARLSATADRVGELSTGTRGLRAVFDSAYHALDPPTQRVFRLLGLHPGPDATSESVAAMAGLSPADARRRLDELVDAQLLSCDTSDRYRLHDLLRDHAATMACTTDNPADRKQVLHRVLWWYLYAADRARNAMFPHLRDIVLDPSREPEYLPVFTDSEQAFRWLTAEHPTMIAAVCTAFSEGFYDIAWQLPVLLKHYFERSGQYDDWLDTGRIALTAARQTGEPRAERIVRGFLGVAMGQLDRLDEAIEHLTKAWRILDDTGDAVGAAKMLNNVGLAYRAQGRLPRAIDALRTALKLAEESGDRILVTRVLSNLGWTYVTAGDDDKALPALQEALTSSQRANDPIGVLAALQHFGEALVRSGRPAEAIPYLEDALMRHRKLHYRRYEAETLELLADALAAVGRSADGEARRAEARAILRELDRRRPSVDESSSALVHVQSQRSGQHNH